MNRSIYIQFALVAVALLVLFYVALFKEEQYTERPTDIDIRIGGREEVYEEPDEEVGSDIEIELVTSSKKDEEESKTGERDEITVERQPTPERPRPTPATPGQQPNRPDRKQPNAKKPPRENQPGGPPPPGARNETSYNAGKQDETLYK